MKNKIKINIVYGNHGTLVSNAESICPLRMEGFSMSQKLTSLERITYSIWQKNKDENNKI